MEEGGQRSSYSWLSSSDDDEEDEGRPSLFDGQVSDEEEVVFEDETQDFIRARRLRREERERRQALRDRPDDYWDQHLDLPPPTDDQGYVVSFAPEDSEGYLPFLRRHGFCVVRILSDEECQASIQEMLQDASERRRKVVPPHNADAPQCTESTTTTTTSSSSSLSPRPRISLDEPHTWESKNWPYLGKFLFHEPAFGQQAFDNRTNEKLYHVFTQIFGETKLWCTIDKWGLMRGSKDLVWRESTSHAPSDSHEAVKTTGEAEAAKTTVDRPDWRWNLHPHWDWNPWVYQAMVGRGLPRMYQGIIALDDCPEEVGGHATIPGSAAYLPHWVTEHKMPHQHWKLVPVPESDPLLRYTRRVPRGHVVIWDAGQAHCNFPNNSPKCRIYQFVRMMPALKECAVRDKHSPFAVIQKHPNVKFWENVELTSLGRKLVGLDPWD